MGTKSDMIYRNLGRCGTKVSALGLGGWTTFGGSLTELDLARRIIRTAFDSGINFFDIADVYARGESEKLMGQVLRDFPRHELVISSKVFWPMSDDINDRGLSRKHIMESIDKSLKRIGVDYLDIYFCHRFDPETPVEETARAMDDLVSAGKILYWGTSEWTGTQLRDVAAWCDKRGHTPPQVEQPQYNLLSRDKFEKDVAPAAKDLGMGTVIWSPLASGVLSGKYDQGIPEGSRLDRIPWLRDGLLVEEKLAKVRRFGELAARFSTTRSQLAIAWAMGHPTVSSVILGATSVEQLQENLSALHTACSSDLRSELEELFS
jgi:voltage-dependent potassium channel beta subunit